MSTPVAPENTSRRQQLRQTYRMAKRTDPRIGLWTLGAAVVAGAIGFLVSWLLPGDGIISWSLTILTTILATLLGASIMFGRRAQKSYYAQMDGQAGAAAAALQMLRRGWRTDPVVAFTKQQDAVHRVVGPPGIVLVAEGNPNRVRQLLVSERRKHERVASEVPIHEVVVGNGEGQVPISKLVKHVQKLGKGIKGPQMTDLLNRLKALDAARPTVPLPKGPVPTSMKGLRQGMRGR